MHSYYALITAGSIFTLVAFMHLLRLVFKSHVIIAGKVIPMWVSIIGFLLPLLLAVWMFTASSAHALPGDDAAFKLQSSAFTEASPIPSRYTCNGNNVSPPLSWQNAPKDAKSFVLTMDDPDAPSGIWDHWIIFNIPASTHALSEGLSTLPSGARYGKNSWGKSSYDGPCPPEGEHHYYFKIYALDTILKLPADASKSDVEMAMRSHTLGEAKLMGKYKK